MYYPKILGTDTDEPFTYLKSNFFLEHHELETAVFYIKKEKKSLIDIHSFGSTWDLLIQSSDKISRRSPSEIIGPEFLKHKKDDF